MTRRLCAHADDGQPMHFLEPDEKCRTAAERTAAAACHDHVQLCTRLLGRLEDDALDDATITAWAESATAVAGAMRALVAPPRLKAVP
jgi:hypothetical protein